MVSVALGTKSFKNIDAFLARCHRRRFPARSTLIQAGDKSESLYYIISGSVVVSIEDESGREIIVAYLNPGDFFGEMGMFDSEQRSAWVRAKTESEIGEISYRKFETFTRDHPEFLFAISAQMAKRLRATTQKMGDLAFLDVTGRIARALLDLTKEPDAMTHPDGMQIKITRQDLGRICGCSREMAGRVLKSLEDQGLITAHGKTVVVFNTR